MTPVQHIRVRVLQKQCLFTGQGSKVSLLYQRKPLAYIEILHIFLYNPHFVLIIRDRLLFCSLRAVLHTASKVIFKNP